LTISRFKDV